MKNKNYSLQLKTANRIKTINIEWYSNECDNVRISLELCGEKIEFSDVSTEGVLNQLSKMLNDKHEIQSCYTCRYGNFCPTGDMDNEIFCINDFEPKCKEDIYFQTEDAKERKKRSRTLFDVCDDFRPCSKDYFTYK